MLVQDLALNNNLVSNAGNSDGGSDAFMPFGHTSRLISSGKSHVCIAPAGTPMPNAVFSGLPASMLC
jgi:hypothetical protein